MNKCSFVTDVMETSFLIVCASVASNVGDDICCEREGSGGSGDGACKKRAFVGDTLTEIDDDTLPIVL